MGPANVANMLQGMVGWEAVLHIWKASDSPGTALGPVLLVSRHFEINLIHRSSILTSNHTRSTKCLPSCWAKCHMSSAV